MTFANSLKRFKNDTSGTTLVEFAVCIGLFLLILFAVLDFGRLGYNWVMTEKAMQRAVRIAVVRPPVCAGVPVYHRRSVSDTSSFNPGARCSSNGDLCENYQTQCLLSSPTTAPQDALALETANEIWDSVSVLLPNGATRRNVMVEYVQTDALGFLGGPFTPVVNVQLVGDPATDPYCFEFITPLSNLAGTVASANGTDAENFDDTDRCTGARIPFPAIAVQLPAEDMNIGDNG